MKRKWVSAVLAATLIASTTGAIVQPKQAQATTVSTIIDQTLLSKVTSMLDTDSLKVILTYNTKPTETDLNLLNNLGITTGQTFKELPMVVSSLSKLQLQSLLNANLPNLQSIYADKELEYFMDKSAAQIGAVKNRETAGMGFTGKGVGVAVLDSGIDGTHPDLAFGNRTVQNVKIVEDLTGTLQSKPVYLENIPDTDNAGGHGTHCAGTIGGDGTGSGGVYKGVAPEANLIGISAGATILVTSALAGLDYVLANHDTYNIQVVSNSWGSTGAYDENDPINLATKKLHDAGVTVVFAAGNEGPNANTINPYSVAPWVISVGAGNKETGTLADFSSRGIRGDALYKPTIVAPGVDIISAKAKQSVLSPLSLQNDLAMIPTEHQVNYTTMSGTSMATPHISGVIALLEQANPNLTPDQTRAILEDTATRMPGYEAFEVGKGYVNAFAAIDKALHPEHAYGAVLNQTFNSTYSGSVDSIEPTNTSWSPLTPATFSFDVKDNAQVTDLLVQWDNLANLLTVKLTAPDGTVTTHNANPLGAVYGTQTAVALPTPKKGTWKVEVTGAQGTLIGLPDTVHFSYRTYYGSFSGMDDTKGHLYEQAIREGVSKRLIDSVDATRFAPDSLVYKGDLVRWIASDFEIRQNQTNVKSYQDVSPFLAPFVAAVSSDAAPMRDVFWNGGNVIAPSSATNFGVNEVVTRAALAKALVKALGLDAQAQQNMSTTTNFTDDAQIPADARGYVVVAEQQGLLDGYLNAGGTSYSFKPAEHVTRGAFAYSLVKGYQNFMQ